MTKPKPKKEGPLEEEPREKDKLPVVPDAEVPSPEEIKLPGEPGPEKLVDQMSHADGSDQGAHPSDSDQPVGLTVVSWWKRFGQGALPDSISEIQRRIEPLARKVAA